MSGIIDELMRLEGAKQKALIHANAPAYDECVREQLHVLNSGSELKSEAEASPDKLLAFVKMTRENSRLLKNLLSTTPVLSIHYTSYTSAGQAETPVNGQ